MPLWWSTYWLQPRNCGNAALCPTDWLVVDEGLKKPAFLDYQLLFEFQRSLVIINEPVRPNGHISLSRPGGGVEAIDPRAI